MDTFRKWLNKPKADDKSLLARFYHADRALAAVASELDSFDGRSEPDRCSRLVSRLRQSQDKVLFITNLIMDELLGDDRDPRSFRAKFPEEVLQENLGGQLWFGAECLAAGSSIMNREQESKDMRPLAQAVTKSLGNVRNLLRDQCLRNNVPNSRTLHLNLNDSSTEQLCESLKIFDRLFAEFELRYVSAMVQVKTKQEYEMQELICVLFSETLQRALSIGLLEQDKVDSFDPALMFSIPRLAIICGLVIYQRGPLNMDMAADQLSEMFRPFRTILIKIRNLLRSLNKNELHQLERLLCTNEDIHLKVEVGSSSIEAPPSLDQQNNNEGSKSGCTKTNQNSNYDDKRHSFSGDNGGPNKTIKSPLKDNNNPTSSSGNAVHQAASSSSSHKRVLQSTSNATHSLKTACTVLGAPTCSPVFSVSADSSTTSTPTVSPVASPTPSHSIASISSVVSISTTSPTEWTDDDEDNASDVDEDVDEDEVLPKEQDIVSADCASGYLIPNTNFGNLLQPQEVPLTDNFVASEDEFAGNQTDAEHTSTTLTDLPSTSTVSTHNCTTSTHTYTSEESEQLTIKASSKSERSMVSKSDGSSRSTSSCSCSRRQECHQHQQESSSSNIASDEVVRRHHHHHAHRHHHHRHHHHHHHHRHQHSKSTRSTVVGEREGEMNQDTNGSTTAKGGLKKSHTSQHWVSKHSSIEDISSADSTSASSVSDGDSHEVSMALRAAGRHKFKSIENLLHRLFVCIAGVADQLQTNFASDLRQILRSVFLMNMSSSEEEVLDIPEKTKESELFEFRASENDVIQESAGSNQSIYSAEEVNPELDNVFNNSGSAAVIQRIHTIDLGDNSEATVAANMRNTMGRSRSLGDQNEIETGTSGSSSNSNNNNARNLSSYINGGRLSSPSRQPAMLQRHRNRNNSVGTNSSVSSSSSSSSPSSSSSSESNSPVSERVSTCFPPTSNCSQSSANSVTANNNNSAVEEGPTGGFLTSPSTQSQSLRLAPPAWIPDEKAPRCMSCHTPFTAFRRRHHCRNCGGVFCGVCSNASAPLPKYGLTKAVRMCRECYMREIRSVNSMRNNAPPRAAVSMQHPTAAAIVGS